MVLEEMGKIHERNMEKFVTPYRRDKAIVILGDRCWQQML